MSKLYYVTAAQGGSAPSYNIFIEKSTDSGATWVTVYNGPLGTTNFDVLLIGGVLHIFGDNVNDNNNLWLFRFDTSTDLMLDAGTDLGIVYTVNPGVKVGQFAGGNVLVTFKPPGVVPDTYLYDPVGNTLGAGVPCDGALAGASVLGTVIDPGTDTAFVFLDASGDHGTPVSCISVTNANVQGAVVSAFSLDTAGGNFSSRQVGRPCMSGGKICIPYVFSLSTFSVIGTLRVARATPANSPVFADELVFTDSQPPFLWSTTASGNCPFIPSLVDAGGTLHIFFQTNESQNEDGSSQASLFHAQSSGPGVWTVAAAIFTGAAGSSNLSCYPLALTGGDIGIVDGSCDPSTFSLDGSWTIDYITLAGPTSVVIASGQTYASSLPTTNNGPAGLLFEIGGAAPISLACPSSVATLDEPYSSAFVVTGGTAPFTFSITAGALPPGLVLDPVTGAVTGTPTLVGTFSYSAQVVDSAMQTATNDCTIVVSADVEVDILFFGVVRFMIQDTGASLARVGLACASCFSLFVRLLVSFAAGVAAAALWIVYGLVWFAQAVLRARRAVVVAFVGVAIATGTVCGLVLFAASFGRYLYEYPRALDATNFVIAGLVAWLNWESPGRA